MTEKNKIDIPDVGEKGPLSPEFNDTNSETGSETGSPETSPNDLPKIGVKNGWATSQGQLTALFVVANMAFSYFGYNKITPDKMQTWYDAIGPLLSTVVPLLANIPVLIHYIISRGKLYSNSMKATAFINRAGFVGGGQVGQPFEARDFAGGITSSILGGTSWKDPNRYINILKDAAALGVPKIGGVVSSIQNNAGTQTRTLSDADILAAFDQLGQNDVELNRKLGLLIAQNPAKS